MPTKLYRATIPCNLAVEANSYTEARQAMRALYNEVMADLPSGAGVFMKDRAWEEVMQAMVED